MEVSGQPRAPVISPLGRSPRHPLDRRESGWTQWRKENFLAPAGNRTLVAQPLGCGHMCLFPIQGFVWSSEKTTKSLSQASQLHGSHLKLLRCELQLMYRYADILKRGLEM